MDCLVTLFGLCLFDPSAVAIELDARWQINGPPYNFRRDGSPYKEAIGRAAIIVDVPATRTLNFRYGIEHRSYINLPDDHGEESAVVGLVWRPFATSDRR